MNTFPDIKPPFRNGFAISVLRIYHKNGWDPYTEESFNIVNEKGVNQLAEDYSKIEVLFSKTVHYYKIHGYSKVGLLSSDLNVLFPVEFSDIEILSAQSTHYFKITTNSKVGLYSSTLKEIFPIEYSNIDVDFHEGIIRTVKELEKSSSALIEYINLKGKVLRSFTVDRALIFSRTYNDEALVIDNQKLDKLFPLFYNSYCIVMCRSHRGILNTNGSYIIPPVYDELTIINKKVVIASLQTKYGIISFNETILLDFNYDRIEYIQNNYFIVGQGNSEGIFNLLHPQKLRLKKIKYQTLSEEAVLVCKEDRNSGKKFGFEDFEGKELIPIVYDYLSNFTNGISIASLKSQKGLINRKNRIIQTLRFDSIKLINESDCGYFITKLKEKFGILNPDGSELVAPLYSKIEFLSSCFKVEKKGYYNYLQFDGAFEYDEWQQIDDGSDSRYTEKELNDMYRDAFDGVADASWNVD